VSNPGQRPFLGPTVESQECDENIAVRATAPLPGFIRLFLIPFAISLLVVRGGYQLHELATTATAPEQTSSIQVRLITGAEPIAAPKKTPLITPTPTTQTRERAEEPERAADREMPVEAPSINNSEPAPRESTPASKPVASFQSSTATNFQKALLRHIERYQNYPGAAKRLRLQGTVLVLFSMRRDGTVLDVWIKTGSGAAILDKEAVDTIKRAQPLPPIPPELPSRLNVIVPVAFNLS